MRNRIVDYRGDVISYPQGYEKSLNSIVEMIHSMADANVDISDMHVVLAKLMSEAHFHILFHLPKELRTNDQQNQTNSNQDQTSTQEDRTTSNP